MLLYLAGITICLYMIRKYQESKWGVCKSTSRLDGKVVVITGANSGIGKETARELAKRGAIIVLACRNKQAAVNAVKDIRTTTVDGDLIVVELDLASLASVKKCAENILEKFSHIDILINNAGVVYPTDMKMETSDGYEIHFGVNHLGHFLLTALLFNRIKDTDDSRIIIVSSSLYKSGHIDFENIAKCPTTSIIRKGHSPLYADSKLCNLLHAQELSKKLTGTSVRTFVVCPGFVYSSLFRHMMNKYSFLQKVAFLPIAFFFMRTAKQGAQTSVYCAVSEELHSIPFSFYRDCKQCELEPNARDGVTAAHLWDLSMSLVKSYL